MPPQVTQNHSTYFIFLCMVLVHFIMIEIVVVRIRHGLFTVRSLVVRVVNRDGHLLLFPFSSAQDTENIDDKVIIG